MCYQLYRCLERALAGADRLPTSDRTPFLRLAAWWLSWAEELTARVPYVYLDYRIWSGSWPTRHLSDVPAAPYDVGDEMTRT